MENLSKHNLLQQSMQSSKNCKNFPNLCHYGKILLLVSGEQPNEEQLKKASKGQSLIRF